MAPSTPPRILLTGASGFIGRHLLEELKQDHRIFGLARRSQHRCGAPEHENIDWFQVDIGEREPLFAVFREIQERGGVDLVIHLAAHYDFESESSPEYQRTNVEGLRNVLDATRELAPSRFIFSSSLAACRFPSPGQRLVESSVPDGEHIYARTKAIGEQMVREYEADFPSTIVRFAALFSDWCEYPPLFMFLATWLGPSWNRNMLGGRGGSAIPFLHVKDAIAFLHQLICRHALLEPGEVVIASPDEAVSHLQLFVESTSLFRGPGRRPVGIPRLLVRPGIALRCALGRLTGDMPFERPWMARYVDQAMPVDASRSRERLDWAPRERLEILRRMPFLLGNLRSEPLEWNRRNRAAMEHIALRPNLTIQALLRERRDRICDALTAALTGEASQEDFPAYQQVHPNHHQWNHRAAVLQLTNTILTRERSIFLSYCRDLAERRLEQGFGVDEVCGAIQALGRVSRSVIQDAAIEAGVEGYLVEYIDSNIHFGVDAIRDTFETLEARANRRSELQKRSSLPAGA